MRNFSRPVSNLPPDQEAIRQKCFHPTGAFVEFEKADVEKSIPDRFEKIAATYPGRIAVKTRTQALSYFDLNQRANRVASALLGRRGDDNEPIGILLENDAPMAAAVLGVLKAGKIYVPMDGSHPQARLAYIKNHTQAKLVLTDHKNLSAARELAQTGCELLNLEELDSSFSPENPGLNISPDSLAYIRYTSGSTGEPKGVMETHRNLLHVIMRQTNAFHICADDRLMFFGSWGKHIFRGLLNGPGLYPARVKEEGLAHLREWLAQEEITILHSIPSVFRDFVETSAGNEAFPSLRMIRLAGEPVSGKDVELFKNHFSDKCILVNELGSTEAGTIAHYLIDKETQISTNAVPVGYPAEDIEIMLLAAGERAGPDHIGEIAIKSGYLSPGYWRRPDLTKAAFVADPEAGGERIYLTGDLGLVRSDGCLLHLGRKDLQLKIRGNRVEIAEIEMALLRHAGIREAVVLAREDRKGDPRLVAYVVFAKGPAPLAHELAGFLRAKLPAYMLPSAYVFLDAMPLTANGKLDRRALPPPPDLRANLGTPFVAPTTPAEKELARLWAEVLLLNRVGVDDNFFDLGGHSLQAATLLARVAKIFGKDLPPRVLLQAPTVRQLARLITERVPSNPWSSLVPLQPSGSKPPFFWVHGEASDAFLPRYLGPEQRLYGLAHQSEDGNPARFTSVESIAAHYLSEIRTVQPEGPYFLGGYCFGGLIAIEMARQLQDQHQIVPLLALLEPTCIRSCRGAPVVPAESRGLATTAASLRNFVHRHLGALETRDPLQKLSYLLCGIKRKLNQDAKIITIPVKSFAKRVICKPYLRLGYALPRWLRSAYILRIYHHATRKYLLRPWADRLTLFICQQTLSNSRVYWHRLARGTVELRGIPGDHAGVLREPDVGAWAEELKNVLDSAQAQISAASADDHLAPLEASPPRTATVADQDLR